MSIKIVVGRFGGQSALAKHLGKGQSTIAYWVKQNTIPSKWHAPLLALAQEQGIDLTPGDLMGGIPDVEITPRLPVGQFPGTLVVGDAEIKCYVLDDGRRVISRVGATEFISETPGQGDLEGYLRAGSLKPYLPRRWKDELIDFTLPEVKHKRVAGLRAETFHDICRAFMEAREAGGLTDRQVEMAKRATQFIMACSKVGLIALIDEVTGYQYERAADALQWKLKLFLEEEMRAWEKTFPDELWREFGRLTGWTDPISARPKYWGKLVMELVYGYLDEDVAKWLRDHAPAPRHGQNYHQWLSGQYGLQKLHDHIWLLIGVASTCDSMIELRDQMAYKFGKIPMQLTFITDPPRRN